MIYNNDILRVPYGNDFRVQVCYKNCVPSQEGSSFADIEGLTVERVRFNGNEAAEYELTASGDIIVSFPADTTVKTLYGIEARGTYQGRPWRWKSRPIVRVVDANACSNVQGMETFGEETYFLDDTFDVEVDGDTMTITTHGLSSLTYEHDEEGGTICTFTLQSGDDVDIDTRGETINIEEYGNKQNCNQGQAWERCRI